ncbi:MAG TPA: dienelactone hydrolase family protein [Gemmatimonadaceae bacterium]|nr:dienelactone hydrolase family protein [Gemmatimonadaceae bacterium]
MSGARLAGLSSIAFAILFILEPREARAQAAFAPPETVVVNSGGLRLKALLWRPSGPGPFPAVVFNHGEAPQAMTAAQAETVIRSALGPAFQRHGYLLLAPFRRGEGLSRGEGTSIQEAVAKRAAAATDSGTLHDSLLATEQLDDVRAAIAYVRTRPDVNRDRVSVAGHSQGGVLAILAGARDSTLYSVLDFAGAERGWNFPSIRRLLTDAVGRLNVPLLMVHAANGNPQPGIAMHEALKARGRPSRLLVYPPFGSTFEEAHRFVLLAIPKWETDVFAFLEHRS